MSTALPLINPPNGSDDNDEFHALVKPDKQEEEKSSEGLVQGLMRAIDEKTKFGLLLRKWGRHIDFIIRLMLVSTFLDDSFRTLMHFSEEASQIGESALLVWLAPFLTKIVLAMCVLAQIVGSICVLALVHPNSATKVLIGWVIAQPMLNGQLSNLGFITESLTLIGGLLMLYAHVSTVGKNDSRVARTQMIGRMLLPAVYLYRVTRYLSSAFTLNETTSLGMYISSLSAFVINVALVTALLIGSALMATGLKSRCVAFFLAIMNIAFVCHQHPFLLYVVRKDGEWKYNEFMPLPNAAGLPVDGYNASDFELSQIYNLHVYYFFLGLSNTGALLLLTRFGPGESAIEKDEVLLPKVRRGEC